MRRKIVVEPVGYDFLRATMYRRFLLFFWTVEMRTHTNKANINLLNIDVERWRQSKELSKAQIVHRGFAGRDHVVDEALLYLRGWYFKMILKAQIKKANTYCGITKRKVWVISNSKGAPRAVTRQEIMAMKRSGKIRKNASPIDFDREAFYFITYDKLAENYKLLS